VPDRYVQLPNGSYLQWPEGVSAATFKAKATKLMGEKPSTPPDRVSDSVGKITGISAYHPKTGLAGIEEKMGDWRQQLSEFANKGAGSYKVGNTSDIGDFMASGPMGLLRAGKGVSEIPQGKIWQGVKDVAGGGMEAATIPSMMFAPEGAGFAKNLLPSTEKAGKMIEAVEQVAGNVPVNVGRIGDAAFKVKESADAGGRTPKIINDFVNRVTKPGSGRLTFKEARRFYENATRLSFDEFNRLNPKSKYLLTQFTKALDQSIQDAAESVGQLQNYGKAMKMYKNAAGLRDVGKNVKTKVLPMAAKSAAGAAGAGLGYQLYKQLFP
jgi:hypothetical protein